MNGCLQQMGVDTSLPRDFAVLDGLVSLSPVTLVSPHPLSKGDFAVSVAPAPLPCGPGKSQAGAASQFHLPIQ